LEGDSGKRADAQLARGGRGITEREKGGKLGIRQEESNESREEGRIHTRVRFKEEPEKGSDFEGGTAGGEGHRGKNNQKSHEEEQSLSGGSK